LVFRYTQGVFTNQHLATVGLEYFTKEEKIEDKIVRVKIWDTAGQEQYKALTRNFYRNSDGVIIVYDVTQKSTFEKIQEWVQSIMDNTEKTIKMVLVGNKIDLPREVTTEEGKKLADFYKIPFFETSAKENIGINEFMRKIISEVLESFKPNENLKLESKDNATSKGCKC
jgi:small GTP-binding protein